MVKGLPRFVRVRPAAKHVPGQYRGETAVVLEDAQLSGQPWLRVQFEDGREAWTMESRTEPAP